MDVSELWLRSYADPAIDGEELAERLTMAGIEVEERRPVAPPFSGVVVAEVRSVAGHPNADKLTVCEVDAGQASLLQIVCGAPNVAPGIRVPCALPGAVSISRRPRCEASSREACCARRASSVCPTSTAD